MSGGMGPEAIEARRAARQAEAEAKERAEATLERRTLHWAKVFALVCAGIAALLFGRAATVEMHPEGYTHDSLLGRACAFSQCEPLRNRR